MSVLITLEKSGTGRRPGMGLHRGTPHDARVHLTAASIACYITPNPLGIGGAGFGRFKKRKCRVLRGY